MSDTSPATSAIIGLGYVGLPLAVEFGKHRRMIQFDINSARNVAAAPGGTTDGRDRHVFCDLKSVLGVGESDMRL